ncbi:hypothetical protein ACNVED_05890 [Legionella sp. D16C41]|uniref:hypothetical protein n=1 Tax=Legionella sp. D16C41 TaxID=3402688 RepID=UPI003AF915A7
MIIKEIDNPGRGNCAFYAFAIGIIDIIKHEAARGGDSVTFKKFYDLSRTASQEFSITLEDIKKFDYNNQDYSLLNEMQSCLRFIIYNHRKVELLTRSLNSPDEVPPTAFIDFMEMVHCFAKDEPAEANYNSLIYSTGVREYAKEIANKIKLMNQRMERLAKWYPENKTDKDYSEARRKYMFNHFDEPINRLILKAFKDDLYVNDSPTLKLKNTSYILAAIKNITVNNCWGTHRDLDELASIFKIDLNTINYGNVRYLYGADRGSKSPTITLNNKNNGHWTTNLTFLGHFNGKKYDIFTKDSILTKEEIKKILLTYTSGWKAILTNRHHLIKAQALIDACNNKQTDILNILDNLIAYTANTNFAANSSFKKRVDYILERAKSSSLLDEQSIEMTMSLN